MINFASLFNQFRMGGGNSSINELIDNPNTTIGRLLDEESFINELKSGNSKINDYMKYDKYETLVEYVTQVGPEDDRKRSYKYPISASDVLSSDSQAPIEFFFPDKTLYVTEQVEPEKEQSPEPQNNNDEADAKITSVESIDEPKQETEKPQTTQEEPNEATTEEVSGEQESAITAETPSKVQSEKEEVKQELKIIQKEVPPLSEKLFSYYEGQVNYTLAGYVSKIFGSFLSKKPSQVLAFLLDEKRFAHLLNHIESRSVSELVVKILTHESIELLEERKQAFDSMLAKASGKEEIYTISNLSASICEIIQKVSGALKGNSNQSANELSALYFKPDIITKVITNVMSDEENTSVYNAPILSTYLTNVPLILPENDQLVGDLKALLQSFLSKALNKLKVTRQSRRTLGFGRVKIVEIMSFVLKQNILQCQDLAANQTEFFPTLFSLCQNYQLNNVLHNQVVKIIQIALSQEETSPFLQSLIKDEVLLKFLSDETNEDMKIKAGSGSQKVRKGYIGHIVQICRKLQEYAEKNSEVKAVIQKPEFDFILQNLVNRQIFQNSKNLAGYGMNKKQKNTILFMKQEVIQEHLKFLMETPAPVYESQPQHINITHPDVEAAEHQQMQSSSNACELLARQVAEEKEVNQDEVQEIDPKFWVGHIVYDIDDLMNDL